MSPKIKKLIFSFFLLILVPNSVYAELDSTKYESVFYKNGIYGSIGIGPIFTAKGYYERILGEQKKKIHLAAFFRGGYGGYEVWGIGGPYIMAEGGIITGAKKAHFEATLGINYFLSGDMEGLLPSGSIGFRRQKPGGNFIFRTGVGFPELAYIGFGVCF